MKDARFGRALVYHLVASGSFGLAAVPFVLAAPISPGPEQWDLQPPGDCTQEQHDKLEAEVTKYCKGLPAHKCTQNQDCDKLINNSKLFERCIPPREKIMKECFRGGNSGHQTRVKEEKVGLKDCTDFIKKIPGCEDKKKESEKGGTCPN